jgi:hypothetical protein
MVVETLGEFRRMFKRMPYGSWLMLIGLTLVVLGCLAYLFSRTAHLVALAPVITGGLLAVCGAALDSDYPSSAVQQGLLATVITGFFLSFAGLVELMQALSGEFIVYPTAMVVNTLTALLCLAGILYALYSFVRGLEKRGEEIYGDALHH